MSSYGMHAMRLSTGHQLLKRYARHVSKDSRASCGCERDWPSRDPMGWIRPHAQHIFIETKDPPSSWAAYPVLQGGAKRMEESVSARNRSTDGSRVLLNLCHPLYPPRAPDTDTDPNNDPNNDTDVDVEPDRCLVFPRGTKGPLAPSLPSTPEPTRLDGHEGLSGPQIFMCAHGQRDSRCGTASRLVVPLVEGWARAYGRGTRVLATSHLGGHKFAGLLLIYVPPSKISNPDLAGGDGDGKRAVDADDWSCVWYGKVTPENVVRVLDTTIRDREVVPDLVRYTSGTFTRHNESMNE